ncbi:NmrA family transcriptional regulator [Streptomyces griseocarneus]|nr:NmrA family transcriptional regulator [Streptomyces griseocarneus]
MKSIVVFGAGGRAGTAVVTEALRRGARVTAIVRDPEKYKALGGLGATVVAGDVRDAASVATVAAGHDAAVHAAAPSDAEPTEFFVGAANALLDGLGKAGVSRLATIGLAANLEVAPGVRMMDTPDFPAEYRPFADAHAAALGVLRAAAGGVDWVVLTPPVMFDPDGPRTGAYRTGGDSMLANDEGVSHVSYADFAIAIVDEIESPKIHRGRTSVAD